MTTYQVLGTVNVGETMSVSVEAASPNEAIKRAAARYPHGRDWRLPAHANATLMVIEFHEPVNAGDLECIRDAIYASPPITPEVKDAYIAYDDGFGRIIRKEVTE